MSLTNTTARSAAFAASMAACHMVASGGDQPIVICAGRKPGNGDLPMNSTRIDAGWPAGRSTAAMVSWLALLMMSCSLIHTRAIPLPLNEIRCRPETVGVNVPVQRADQTVGNPAGVVVTFTVGSTLVIAGVPLRSGEVKYSAVKPGPVPEVGVSVLVSSTGGAAVPSVPGA